MAERVVIGGDVVPVEDRVGGFAYRVEKKRFASGRDAAEWVLYNVVNTERIEAVLHGEREIVALTSGWKVTVTWSEVGDKYEVLVGWEPAACG